MSVSVAPRARALKPEVRRAGSVLRRSPARLLTGSPERVASAGFRPYVFKEEMPEPELEQPRWTPLHEACSKGRYADAFWWVRHMSEEEVCLTSPPDVALRGTKKVWGLGADVRQHVRTYAHAGAFTRTYARRKFVRPYVRTSVRPYVRTCVRTPVTLHVPY